MPLEPGHIYVETDEEYANSLRNAAAFGYINKGRLTRPRAIFVTLGGQTVHSGMDLGLYFYHWTDDRSMKLQGASPTFGDDYERIT